MLSFSSLYQAHSGVGLVGDPPVVVASEGDESVYLLQRSTRRAELLAAVDYFIHSGKSKDDDELSERVLGKAAQTEKG